MANWLKSFFKSVSLEGQLWKLVKLENNYLGSAIFLTSKLESSKSEILIHNCEYDPLQDQLKSMAFSKSNCSNFSHVIIESDSSKIHCLKWVFSQNSVDLIYKFEFFQEITCEKIKNFLRVSVDEEGLQKPFDFRTFPSQLYTNSKESCINNLQNLPVGIENHEEDSDFSFKRNAIENLSSLYETHQILYVSAGDLYLNDEIVEEGIGFLLIKHENFVVTLDIIRENQVIMRILIDKYFSYIVNPKKHIFEFIENFENSQRHWKAKLTENLDNLNEILLKIMFESERKITISEDLDPEDLDWLQKNDENCSESSESREKSSECEESLESPDSALLEDEITDSVLSNSNIFVGSLNSLSIFSEQNSEICKNASIPIVNKFQDSDFSPVMLLPKPSGIMMINQLKPHSLFLMDLHKEKIKSAYHLNKGAIKGISNGQSINPLDTHVITSNEIFSIDPRVPKYIVNEYKYSKNPYFSSVSTNFEGNLAIGSEKGEIRLYSKVGQKAKSLFLGYGHSIIAIDTTKDSSWIVATTETYLIALPTSAYGNNGYLKSITKKFRKARILKLLPEDLAKFNISSVSFTPAKFGSISNNEENAIITSTHNFLVVWNFKSVKNGKCMIYKIREMKKKIIKNQFLNNRNEALVTYDKGIELQFRNVNSLI